MKYTYTTQGICAKTIEMELENDVLKNVKFIGGCDGNLKAVASLVEGMPVAQVKERLSGIRCGNKQTSCADQLVKGVEEALRGGAA